MTPDDRFQIFSAREREIADDDLKALLWHAYVDAGFTAPDVATVSFAPAAVRARGAMLVAWRVGAAREAVGLVMVVPPTSSARRIATEREIEMHLLAVRADQRGQGIGRRLVERSLIEGEQTGCDKMVLWTQPTMLAAQRIYAACGFVRAPARNQEITALTKKEFLVFERSLAHACRR